MAERKKDVCRKSSDSSIIRCVCVCVFVLVFFAFLCFPRMKEMLGRSKEGEVKLCCSIINSYNIDNIVIRVESSKTLIRGDRLFP